MVPIPCHLHLRVQGTRHAEFVAVDALLQQAGGDAAAARFPE